LRAALGASRRCFELGFDPFEGRLSFSGRRMYFLMKLMRLMALSGLLPESWPSSADYFHADELEKNSS
jgi:hypothetical protein